MYLYEYRTNAHAHIGNLLPPEMCLGVATNNTNIKTKQQNETSKKKIRELTLYRAHTHTHIKLNSSLYSQFGRLICRRFPCCPFLSTTHKIIPRRECCTTSASHSLRKWQKLLIFIFVLQVLFVLFVAHTPTSTFHKIWPMLLLLLLVNNLVFG